MLRENGAGKNYLIQHIAGSKAIIIDKINEKYQFFRKLFDDPDMMKQVMETVGSALYERLRRSSYMTQSLE